MKKRNSHVAKLRCAGARTIRGGLALGLVAFTACAVPSAEKQDLADFFSGDAKADLGSSAKIVDNIALGSTVSGQFDEGTRVYGYVFEVKPGATIRASLTAVAGKYAQHAMGEALDTVLALYGPYTSAADPGPKLISHDDGENGAVVPPPLSYKIAEGGRYLLAFASWDEPGQAATYSLELGCEGTEEQCGPSVLSGPCKQGVHYVQAGSVSGERVTWDTCEVVLLEPTTITENTIVEIQPGVTVKANYLAGSVGQPTGRVALTVAGTLRVMGTKADPVTFAEFVPGYGWPGIRVQKEGTLFMQHANVKNAYVALNVFGHADIRETTLDGNHGGVLGIHFVGQHMNVERSLIHGFPNGIHTLAPGFFLEDSVVRDNATGIVVGQHRPQLPSCTIEPSEKSASLEIHHCDVIDNHHHGIRIYRGSSPKLTVTNSNIKHNPKGGIWNENSALQADVHLSNLVENGSGDMQVKSSHLGTLNLSQNYWGVISDPALSLRIENTCDAGTVNQSDFAIRAFEDAGPRP